MAERRAAQAEVDARRNQHKNTINQERRESGQAQSGAQSTRPKSKLKARLRESKTLEQMPR